MKENSKQQLVEPFETSHSMLHVILTYSSGADQDVAWTLRLCSIASFQEDQVLIVIIHITHSCYLVDWDAMQDILNEVSLGPL